MACASMAVPTSPVTSKAKEEEINGLRRLDSGMNRVGIRRSYSDNHLCCSINRIRAAASTKPTMTKSSSVGFLPSLLPFQISSSIIPNSVRSFLFDDNDDDEEEEIKRANWVNRLLEVHSRWKHRQIEDGVEGGEIYDENENDGNEDEHEGGCEVN